MRERELKLKLTRINQTPESVAPHAGARIETRFQRFSISTCLSLPMRERELKLLSIVGTIL